MAAAMARVYPEDVMPPDTNVGMPAGRPILTPVVTEPDGSSSAELQYPDGRIVPIQAAPHERILSTGAVRDNNLAKIVRGAPGGGTLGLTHADGRNLNNKRKELAAKASRDALVRAANYVDNALAKLAAEAEGKIPAEINSTRTSIQAWGKIVEHIAVISLTKSSRDAIEAAKFVGAASGLTESGRAMDDGQAPIVSGPTLTTSDALKLLRAIDDEVERRAAQQPADAAPRIIDATPRDAT
jgi:hypothetical protein